MFSKGSITKWKRLPRQAQKGVIVDAKKVIKNLEELMKAGSVEEYYEKSDEGSSGGAGTSAQYEAASPPLRRTRQFVASPSPEPLRGNPHHPARHGGRSSYALAAFSPGK